MKPEPSRREINDMAEMCCVGLGNCIEAKRIPEEIVAWSDAARSLMQLGYIMGERQKRVNLRSMSQIKDATMRAATNAQVRGR